MNVVVEGADAGGKSTLCSIVSRALGVRVQQGSGPPRGPGEIERRAREYLQMTGVIFDRHPCVSQPIYGRMRGERLSPEFLELVGQFYAQGNLLVFCRSTSIERHEVKPEESPAHVAALEKNFQQLVDAYEQWAIERAHVIYRIGDDPQQIVDICRRMVP